MIVYNRIADLRISLGYIAEQTGLNLSTVLRCAEADKLPQSPANAEAFAKALSWTMDEALAAGVRPAGRNVVVQSAACPQPATAGAL